VALFGSKELHFHYKN